MFGIQSRQEIKPVTSYSIINPETKALLSSLAPPTSIDRPTKTSCNCLGSLNLLSDMYLLLLGHQTFAASAIAQSVSGNFMFLHMKLARTPTLFLSLPIADSRSLFLLAEESWPVISPGIIKHPGTPNAMLVHTPLADLSHQPSDRLPATLNGDGSSVSYRHSLENEETKHDQRCPGIFFRWTTTTYQFSKHS